MPTKGYLATPKGTFKVGEAEKALHFSEKKGNSSTNISQLCIDFDESISSGLPDLLIS